MPDRDNHREQLTYKWADVFVKVPCYLRNVDLTAANMLMLIVWKNVHSELFHMNNLVDINSNEAHT